MSTVLKQLFGGTETKSQSTSGPKDVTPPEVEALRGKFTTALGNLFGTSTDALAGIPTSGLNLDGQNVAGPTANEEQILQTLIDDLQGPRQDLIRRTLQGEFLPGQPGANPFLQATIEAAQRPTLEGLTQTLERALPGRFTAAGQFVQPEGSSAFDTAAALATRGAAQTLGDIATNIAFGTQEAERGRQQGAIELGQQEIQTLTTNLQAQALPRLIEDLGIQRGLEEYRTRLEALLKALQIATGTPLQTVAQQAQSTSEGESYSGIVPPLFPKGLQGG